MACRCSPLTPDINKTRIPRACAASSRAQGALHTHVYNIIVILVQAHAPNHLCCCWWLQPLLRRSKVHAHKASIVFAASPPETVQRTTSADLYACVCVCVWLNEPTTRKQSNYTLFGFSMISKGMCFFDLFFFSRSTILSLKRLVNHIRTSDTTTRSRTHAPIDYAIMSENLAQLLCTHGYTVIGVITG